MYFWQIHCSSSPDVSLRIPSRSRENAMPLPRLLPAGFMIQAFFVPSSGNCGRVVFSSPTTRWTSETILCPLGFSYASSVVPKTVVAGSSPSSSTAVSAFFFFSAGFFFFASSFSRISAASFSSSVFGAWILSKFRAKWSSSCSSLVFSFFVAVPSQGNSTPGRSRSTLRSSFHSFLVMLPAVSAKVGWSMTSSGSRNARSQTARATCITVAENVMGVLPSRCFKNRRKTACALVILKSSTKS
mmetsp:Transcript_11622/g.25042  ORF Transcript_11622/g.25042 Transcript_11622/m.25042 type:complete len:243 (-) Transcript_11622:48-776(-)